MITAAEILDVANSTFAKRGATYRDNHERLANMLAAAFPNGITLRSVEDHARYALYALILVKLTRYAVQWEEGHEDSTIDAAVYAAMLGARDANNRNQLRPRDHRASDGAATRTHFP